MGISIVVGGQFGSEGKGKTAYWFARELHASSVVRVGGPNSGHTVIDGDGKPAIFQVLPTAAIDREVNCVFPAGSYINTQLLFREIQMSGISPEKIKINPNAAIITDEQRAMEKSEDLPGRIGSTGSGTGASVSMRVMRDPGFVRACDVEELWPYLCDTTGLLRQELDQGNNVLIEGTQGFGLSNLHSPYYPKATARDTTAAGFLHETGLSPFDVEHIILVLRSYPIRVAGNSGPLPQEVSWDVVTAMSGQHEPIQEYTSVTKKLRRVALFDPDIVKQAIAANRPDIIVMNHIDYISGDQGVMSVQRQDFISRAEQQIGQKINYAGLNPSSLIRL